MANRLRQGDPEDPTRPEGRAALPPHVLAEPLSPPSRMGRQAVTPSGYNPPLIVVLSEAYLCIGRVNFNSSSSTPHDDMQARLESANRLQEVLDKKTGVD